MTHRKLMTIAAAALVLGGMLAPTAAMASPATSQHAVVAVAATAKKKTQYELAAAVLKGWPKHPYSALNADGREEYTKAYITKTLAGATVTPVKSTWKQTSKTSAKLVAKIAHKTKNGVRTLSYDTWMTKEHGVWKIGYTIYHF